MRYRIHILYPSHPHAAVSEDLSPSHLVHQKMGPREQGSLSEGSGLIHGSVGMGTLIPATAGPELRLGSPKTPGRERTPARGARVRGQGACGGTALGKPTPARQAEGFQAPAGTDSGVRWGRGRAASIPPGPQ